METIEIQQTISRLTGSVWAFSAITYAAEKGILDQLNEPRTLAYISEQTGAPIVLVERIVDILAALHLAQREGDIVTADKGLIPLITPPARTIFQANLKQNYLESRHLIESAKQPASPIGWNYTDPEVLQATGMVSSRSSAMLYKDLFPGLGDLASRLQAPSARFLDVGTGVAGISISACRGSPTLHVVGLDIQEAPLALARRNVTAAGLTDRIELRQQSIEDLADENAFDLAFLPQFFMPDKVVKRGIENILRALRPGGWVLIPTICVPGMDLPMTLSRLQDTIWGGGCRIPSQIQEWLSEAGFTSIKVFEFPPGGTHNLIVAQRPI